jgi:hypothetical protein
MALLSVNGAQVANTTAFFELVASGPVLVTCDFENPMAGEADPAKREIHLSGGLHHETK